MRSLTEHLNEVMNNVDVNEAKKSVESSIPECPENGNEYEVKPAIDRCYSIASALEDTKKNTNLLKKVGAFKGYDGKKLADYAVCLEQVGGWINGIMALAEDDTAEASTYVGMTKELGIEYQECIENCAQNVDPSDLKSTEDEEDIYDYLEDIFKNWNEVSKAIFKMPWN